MAWYTTGTIAVSGTTVTGTGTNFLDNTQSIGPGQALLIPGSGTVKMYEIASVQSATKLTLKTSAGTIAAGQAYAILSFYTDSVPDFARRLAAQLSYYQSQMDGWQQIMTGTGSVTLTAPDGTNVTISSFAKLTSDIAAAVNSSDYGFGSSINLTASGLDLQAYDFKAGQHIVFFSNNVSNAPAGWPSLPTTTAYGCYLDIIGRSGTTVHMLLTLTSASNDIWGLWQVISTGAAGSRTYTSRKVVTDGTTVVALSTQTDANTMTTSGSFYGQFTNGPIGNAYGIMTVLSRNGTIITQSVTATTANTTWSRTYAGGSWSAWVQSLTTNGGTMTGALAMGGKDITGGGVISGTEINSSIGLNAPKIELSGSTPFIDFHFNNSTADYTARIINTSTAPTLEVSAPTSGTARLRVNGGYQCKGGINGGYGGNCFNFYWQTNSKCEAWIDSSNIGYLSLEAASDKQLKKDIEYKDFTGALAEILQWKVASFKYKARGIIPESDSQIGFIANDLFEVSPECVDGDGLPEDYDIDKEPNKAGAYNLRQVPMIAKLTMAIQEQQKLIASMSDAIQELERAIADKL